MKKGKYLIIIIILIICIISLMDRNYSKFVSNGKVSGLTTIPAKIYDVNVTYKYIYVDENLNEVEFKESVSEIKQGGDVLTLEEVEEDSFDYDEFQYFVNGEEYDDNTYVLNGDTEIKLVYYLTRYTIVYNLDGGMLDNPIGMYTINTETFDLPNPVKENLLFTGWAGTKELESIPIIKRATKLVLNQEYVMGTQNNSSLSVRVTSGSAYAVYVIIDGTDRCVVYTDNASSVVQYRKNNGGWSTINNWKDAADLKYQFFTLSNGGKNPDSGITSFDGSFDEYLEQLNQVVINIPVSNPYTINKGSSGNVEVTAMWHQRQNLTLTFYRNRTNNDNTRSTQTFVEGIPQNLNANTFTRNGYTFSGWTTTRGSTTVEYTDGQEITINANTSLYAIWVR